MPKPAIWQQKRALITGATGFIGRHLVRRLEAMDTQVYAGTSPASRSSSSTPEAERAAGLASKGTTHTLAFDIRDSEAVRGAIRDVTPDVVFHLAAVGVTDVGVDPMTALMVNAGGAINLLEQLRELDVERVVLVGTSYEYGTKGATKGLDPLNGYAASKVAAWAFARMFWRAHGLPIVIVRPFQVYGPGQPQCTLIPAAMRAAMSGEDFLMTPGEQERDFIFAEDVAEGMIAAAETAGIEGTSLDLGTGIGTTVRRAVEQIWEMADAEGSIRLGARPYRTGAPVHLVADADRTAQLTGWRAATSLEKGLRISMRALKFQARQGP